MPASTTLSTITPHADHGRLLALPDDDLRAALATVDADAALNLLAVASSFADQSRVLRSLPVRVRLRVLDPLPAPVLAGLVQNLESENAYLVGQISVERFVELLSLCSPERQLYWLALSTRELTSRSFAFPLSVPPEDLARALLSDSAFRDHARALANFPVWNLRLPPDAMRDPLAALLATYGADGLLREFPLTHGPASEVAAAILEQHPELYLDVIRAALHQLDYAATHPEEEELLATEPVLLRANAIGSAPSPPVVEEAPPPPVRLPIPVLDPLAPVAQILSPARREALAGELHHHLLREAIAAGGSFLASDLEGIASRMAALLQLGGAALGALGPHGLARALAQHSVTDLLAAGARQIEQLRQVALRLRPLRQVLDVRQRSLVQSLLAPRLLLDVERQPALEVIGPGGVRVLPVAEVRALLQRTAAWAELARSLTFCRMAAALREAQDSEAVAAGLALGAVLYGRVEFGLAEPDDLRTFARRYLSAKTHRLLPRARAALQRAAGGMPAPRGVPADALAVALEAGLERLAEVIRAAPTDAAAARRVCYLGKPPESAATFGAEEDEEDSIPLWNEP
ncbi:MAG: hypothetical protein HY320_01975 [Armatimonadetes bacterium]|nr:hypothetical protein [Armatimonadota bacterium]